MWKHTCEYSFNLEVLVTDVICSYLYHTVGYVITILYLKYEKQIYKNSIFNIIFYEYLLIQKV